MTASNAPEEGGRRIWLKIHYGNVIRKVEWNTSWRTFDNLVTKVRQLFHLENRTKLVFQYKEKDDVITMSSDEEWAVALELLSGDTLTLTVEPAKRKKRGMLARAVRAGKFAKVKAVQAATAARASMPEIHLCRSLCAAGRRVCSALGHVWSSLGYVNSRHIGFLMFLLLAALCYNIPRHSLRNSIVPVPRAETVEIVAATYGGIDVTPQVARYYSQHGKVLANNRLYGDPALGRIKYLQVFYRIIDANGYPSPIISEGFEESDREYSLSKKSTGCSWADTAMESRSIRVLGAVYEGIDVTCAAKRNVQPGSVVSAKIFNVMKSTNGAFTILYEKNGSIKISQSKEGQSIKL